MPEADPQAARKEISEHGIDEGGAGEDLSPVEECEREREAEEREQVEVADGKRLPQVRQAEEEDEAEPEPDVRAHERLPAECPLAPARHLPRDLRSRPRLGHPAGRVLDDGLRDL